MAIPAGRTARPTSSFKGEVPGQLQQAMVALAEGEGLPTVLVIVAEVAGCPVAAADAGGRLLAAAGDGADAILAGTMAMTDLAGMVPGEVRSGHIATGRKQLSASVVALGGHTIKGYLLLIENQRPLQSEAAVTVGQLAPAVWLGIRMQKTAAEVEKKYQGEFLRGLLSGQYTSLAEVTARARVWGWDLSQPHVVGVIKFSDSEEDVPEAAVRQVASLAGQVESPPPVTVIDRYVAILLPYQGENLGPAEQMRGLLARLRSAWGAACYAGLGRPYASALDLHRSYREARVALCGTQICGEQAGWRSYDDLGALRLLVEVPAGDLEKHYEQLLGPLERYDLHHSTSLLETLHIYLLAGADAGIAAERLFIHENTLRYRLQKAGALLGLNLASPKSQVALYLLLTAHSLRQHCRELLLQRGGHSIAAVVPRGGSACLPPTGPGPREDSEKLVAAFLALLVKGAANDFAREVLAPLMRVGSRNRTLMETLQAYLEGGTDLRQIAVSLGIHVNTLRYRLKKIEEIYAANLDRMEVRASLYLALQAYQEYGTSAISRKHAVLDIMGGRPQ